MSDFLKSRANTLLPFVTTNKEVIFGEFVKGSELEDSKNYIYYFKKAGQSGYYEVACLNYFDNKNKPVQSYFKGLVGKEVYVFKTPRKKNTIKKKII